MSPLSKCKEDWLIFGYYQILEALFQSGRKFIIYIILVRFLICPLPPLAPWVSNLIVLINCIDKKFRNIWFGNKNQITLHVNVIDGVDSLGAVGGGFDVDDLISFIEDVIVLAVFEVFIVQFFFCVAGCGKLLLQKLKSEFVEGTDCGPAVEGRGAIDHHSAGQWSEVLKSRQTSYTLQCSLWRLQERPWWLLEVVRISKKPGTHRSLVHFHRCCSWCTIPSTASWSRVGPEVVQSWTIFGPKEGVGEVEGERGGEVLLEYQWENGEEIFGSNYTAFYHCSTVIS